MEDIPRLDGFPDSIHRFIEKFIVLPVLTWEISGSVTCVDWSGSGYWTSRPVWGRSERSWIGEVQADAIEIVVQWLHELDDL